MDSVLEECGDSNWRRVVDGGNVVDVILQRAIAPHVVDDATIPSPRRARWVSEGALQLMTN